MNYCNLKYDILVYAGMKYYTKMCLNIITHVIMYVCVAIQLRGGVACVTVSGEGVAGDTSCVEGRPLGDGDWHTITAERHGPNLVVEVDDGDGWRRNESLVSVVTPGEDDRLREPYFPLHLDTEDGITVGTVPELLKESLVDVLDELQDGMCTRSFQLLIVLAAHVKCFIE